MRPESTGRRIVSNLDSLIAFRPAQAAELLGITRPTVYAWMASGKLKSVRVGGVRLIPRTAIEAVLAEAA